MDITYIRAVFGALRSTVTKPLFKIDSGVILQIAGITDLPEYFNTDFSNSEKGTATRMLGHDREVTIPDALLKTGLPIFCWIHVVNETTGRTIYSVKIPVKQRSNVEDAQPTPEQADIITQAITALNNAGDSAQQSASEAQTYAERAETASESAHASETSAGQSAVESQGHAESASQSAQQAAESAQAASSSAQGASQAASSANAAMNNARTAESNARSAESGAQGYAQSAQASASEAEAFSQSADGFARSAHASAQTAQTNAEDAQTSVTNAQAKALDSEAYALGTRNGVDVGTSDPAYHNNAKWYAEQGGAEVTAAQQARQGAEEARSLAETARGKAEAAQTAAETAQVKAEEAAERADVKQDGTYDNMTTGSAKQIISSKYVTDSEPYLLRASSGDGADREYDEIVGGSVAWNQLVGSSATSVTVPNGHKYISKISGVYSVGTSTGTEISVTGGTDELFDITQMLGSTIADHIYNLEQTTAGAGVAWFRKHFPNDYYEYNAGELMHVSDLQSHDMVGFNIVSEPAHVGGYWSTNGNYNDNVQANYASFGDNKWPVVPGMTYCFSVPNIAYQTGIYVATFDKAGNYLTRRSINRVSATTSKIVYTMPDGVYYIGVYFNRSGNGFTEAELKDICINLSGDGKRNGEYEPYVKRSYPLDSNLTLRGIPKLSTDGKLYYDGDHYKSDGTVERRYGIVDLGTLEWTTKATGSMHKSVYTTLPTPYTGHPRGNVDFLSDTYMPSGIGYYSGGNDSKVTSPDDSEVGFLYYSNSNSAKPRSLYLIVGVNDTPAGYLIYTLAEPTTETADPYQSLQICDPYGTEEYVTTGIVPVGHETKYPENLRAKIEGLPWDFSSLIAPTETGTASRNYTVGSLLIMGNVLYKVTANIANGGTITPNTNVVATTLSEVISALA